MSYTERNKGKLIFVAKQPYTINHDLDYMFQDYVEMGDSLYRVEFEIEGEQFYNMANVKVNEDKSIDFDTVHYNGGAHWIEVVEDALNE